MEMEEKEGNEGRGRAEWRKGKKQRRIKQGEKIRTVILAAVIMNAVSQLRLSTCRWIRANVEPSDDI
jgi:hypothetical protein